MSPSGPAMQTVIRTRTVTVFSKELRHRCRCAPGVVPENAARVVYLVRETDLPPASSRSLDVEMYRAVEFGFLTGDFLNNLSTVLKEVYAPLLDQQLGLTSTSTTNGVAMTDDGSSGMNRAGEGSELYQPESVATAASPNVKKIFSGSLSVVLDTLPSMMNAIRMVWVISRHYNTDERMVPLMELIAGEIAEKVRGY